MGEPRLLTDLNWNARGVEYHEYECSRCGKAARNTYSEPNRTNMLQRLLCWDCNYWRDFDARLERDHKRMTIIDGHVYGPGNRTSGPMRGMAGRRFDIEYIAPSIHAGKRITTFDLWSGSTMPDHLRERFADTARFVGGAEKVELGKDAFIQRCWNPSDTQSPPYPLPRSLDLA